MRVGSTHIHTYTHTHMQIHIYFVSPFTSAKNQLNSIKSKNKITTKCATKSMTQYKKVGFPLPQQLYMQITAY